MFSVIFLPLETTNTKARCYWQQGAEHYRNQKRTNHKRSEEKKKNNSTVGAKKGSNNDKPNENGVSVLDWNLSLARLAVEAWLIVTALW